MTLFYLVYGGEVIILIEKEMTSKWVSAYGEDNAKKWVMKLDLVEETRDKAATRLKVYKQRMCQTYNCKVKRHSFQVADMIWKKR